MKLPLKPDVLSWLDEEVVGFPARFLLFCSHVGKLTLESRVQDRLREVSVSEWGDSVTLHAGDVESMWRVIRREHKPSPAASKNAGELARRKSVPVYWAVPLDGTRERGKFWAFFPTEYETTLSGIINAPWKTNEDRQNLLTGDFNCGIARRCGQTSSFPSFGNDQLSRTQRAIWT